MLRSDQVCTEIKVFNEDCASKQPRSVHQYWKPFIFQPATAVVELDQAVGVSTGLSPTTLGFLVDSVVLPLDPSATDLE